jgi:hypothetical protein
MNFTPGDIVSNKFGHILAVGRVREDGIVLCIFECNPSGGYSSYLPTDLRLLSKTRGVDMSHWNSSEFADKIKRCMEWAQNVHGLPPKYKEYKPKAKKEKVDLSDLSTLSDEQLNELLKSTGETVSETKEEVTDGNVGRKFGE